MTAPPSASSPPGWYPDPAGGRMRWWDGTAWNDTAAPYQRTSTTRPPGGRGDRPRGRRGFVLLLVGLASLVALLGGCIALSAKSQNDFMADNADLSSRLLRPTDLVGSWEELEPGEGPPAGPVFPERARRPGYVCPDAQEVMAFTLESTAVLPGRDKLAIAEVRLARPASEPGGTDAYAHQTVHEYWLSTDANDHDEAHRKAWSCGTVWDYTDADGDRWRVRNEVLDSKRFGVNALVARTTYTPVDPDGPGGEPASSDTPTEYLHVVSRKGEQLLLLSLVGIGVDEAETIAIEAYENLER